MIMITWNFHTPEKVIPLAYKLVKSAIKTVFVRFVISYNVNPRPIIIFEEL